MRFDLKEPCENCPFRSDATRITFSCRERAEEIEESAYRNGFPCHKTAVDTSDDDPENGGYVFRSNGKTQHCIGALMMFMADGYSSTPGTGNDDELFERLSARVDWKAPHFASVEDFLNANDPLSVNPTPTRRN
jgi:hypothetical protein